MKIKEIRRVLKLTQEEFGRNVHLTGSYIGAIESAKRIPSDSTLDLIMRHYKINETWWKDGTGDMFKGSDEQKPQTDDRLRLAFAMFERAFNAEKTEEGKNALTSEMFAMLSKKRGEPS